MAELTREVTVPQTVVKDVRNHDHINTLSGDVGQREATRLILKAASRQFEKPGAALLTLFDEWSKRNENKVPDTPDFPIWVVRELIYWWNDMLGTLGLSDKFSLSKAELYAAFGTGCDMPQIMPSLARHIFRRAKGFGKCKGHFQQMLKDCGNSTDKLTETVIAKKAAAKVA